MANEVGTQEPMWDALYGDTIHKYWANAPDSDLIAEVASINGRISELIDCRDQMDYYLQKRMGERRVTKIKGDTHDAVLAPKSWGRHSGQYGDYLPIVEILKDHLNTIFEEAKNKMPPVVKVIKHNRKKKEKE